MTDDQEGAAPAPEEPAVAPEAAPQEAVATEATETTAPETEKPKQVPWFQQRINELTREKHENARRAEAAEAQRALLQTTIDGLKQGAKPEGTAPEPGKTLTEAEIEARVEKRAAERAAVLAFNEACDRTAAAGAKAHTDFDDARRSLVDAFGDVMTAQPHFLEAVTALPNGHEVFYALGKDLNEAARVFKLNRTQMTIELARLGAEVGKAKPTSKAPDPIRPIDGTARGEVDPTKISSFEDFNKWRQKDIADRLKARYAR